MCSASEGRYHALKKKLTKILTPLSRNSGSPFGIQRVANMHAGGESTTASAFPTSDSAGEGEGLGLGQGATL